MKLFPSDWAGFLDHISLWGQLSIPARRVFLDGVRPGLTVEASIDDPPVKELLDAALLTDSDIAGRVSVDAGYVRFHQLLKVLEKIGVFESPGFDVLRDYLTEHYTQNERSLLHESLAFHPDDFSRIASLVTSVEWLEEFLSRDRALRPERETGQSHARILSAARSILKYFMEQRDRVPLKDLEEYFPELERLALASSLRLGVQSAVFFLSLRRSDLEPLIGIWPSAARRLRRASIALAPEPVEAGKRFRHPFLIEDMATLLLSARAEPIPARRTDERPFTRFEEEQADSLLSLPDWLEESTGATPRIRVTAALSALRLSGLLTVSREGDTLRLLPADGGLEWALAGPRERLDAFMRLAVPHAGAPSPAAVLRRFGWRRPPGAPIGTPAGPGAPEKPSGGTPPLGMAEGAGEAPRRAKGAANPRAEVLLALLLGSWASWAEAAVDILPSLVQAFASAPRSSFIRFKDFAGYQTTLSNPLIPLRERGGGASLWARLSALPTDELLEELWQSFLHAYLSFSLLALGGAEAGLDASGQPCFLLTASGRFLLGLSDILEQEEDQALDGGPSSDILVQPTFEIAFLSPCPGAEAEIARFAERVGREVGVLFRISKRSILRAAAAGLPVERVIGTLAGRSRNPVPPNVEREIRDWMRQPSS